MREILFKAKTKMIVGTYNCGKEDGEWVTGCLYCDVGKWIIRQFELDRADYVSYEVDPETVCQYVGFDDKDGKKIFENDFVSCRQYIGGNQVDYCIERGYVEMKHGAFGLHREQGYYRPFKDWLEDYEYEVVGNIFDTPELMS